MVRDQPYDVTNTWANLCPRCDVVPASNVSVKKGWGNLLYLSMRSFVGNILMIEGFVTCRISRCVVAMIVVLALSSGMFHLFASVGVSTILRREVRIVFPGCCLVMLASSFDDWSMLVLAADTQTLD